MNHTSSKVKVFVTDDYKRFASIDGNRPLNKKKIDRIIKEIESGNDFLDANPIVVREQGQRLPVIDGQHRLEICRRLKRPVNYIIHQQETNLHKIAKLNSNVEKWNDQNFINCYIKDKKADYSKLQKFLTDYKVAVGVAIVLIYNGTMAGDKEGNKSKDALRNEFETGVWTARKLREAKLIMETCKSFSEYKGWNSRAFVQAVCVLLEKKLCDFDRLVKKFNRDPRRLTHSGNYKDILVSLESIYNLDNQKRIAIH